MTIQSSGAISLSDLQDEFGGTAPISLSEYYKGGAFVSSGNTSTSIPTSGAISMSDFYGAAAFTPNPLTQVTALSSTGMSFTVPSSVQVGDLVIAYTHVKGTNSSNTDAFTQQTPSGYTQLVDGDGVSRASSGSTYINVGSSIALRVVQSTSERNTSQTLMSAISGTSTQIQETLVTVLRPSLGSLSIHQIGDGDTLSGTSASLRDVEYHLNLPSSAAWPFSSDATGSWYPNSTNVSGQYNGLYLMTSFHETSTRYPTHILPASATSSVTSNNTKMSTLYRAYNASGTNQTYSFGNPSGYYGSNTNGAVGVARYAILYT